MSIRRTHRTVQMALAAVALLCAGIFTGCGGFFQAITTTTGNGGTGDFIYAGKNNSSTLAAYQIGTGGSLTAVSGGLTLPSAPTALAISPNNSFLYAGTAGGIYAFSINSTGSLTALNSGSALTTFSIGAMDISPDGNWLVAIPTSVLINGNAGFLYPLSSSTGLFTGTGAQLPVPINTGTGQAVQFAPTEGGTGVTTSTIAASFGTAGIYTYIFNTSTAGGGAPSSPVGGQLPVAVAVTNASDNGLIWNSAGTAIYFISGGGDQTLYTYPVNTVTGVIGTLAGQISTGTSPTALSFDETGGAYIYVTNAGSNTISGYSVTVSGGTTNFAALSMSPYSTAGSAPDAIVNAGNYMVALNQTGPPDLLLYTVDTVTPGRLYVTTSVTTNLTVASGTSISGGVVLAATN